MPRRRTITKAQIARAVSGAQAGGLKVDRVEIADGTIVIHSGEPAKAETATEFDAWRAKRDARPA
ncbi:hypothetical protein M446_3880 [Methylobacterium sp. 4-46]|uniref:hypothetical protein n=1 Tax=unclassified Methylobacterium TaxID=2615210 RepID=UPI000165C559|nr:MULTISPECIES: hypothetical protein [Methylobacterium]ACA18253.1 hypothetical protein M446_3880 [Methylobacterium sp. 4-46]WFT77548.1 hypothetical protein QA634_19695 [Methylobacterium nodulans]